jgi:hypothetical protein
MKPSLLWVLALVLMFASAAYQRRTGPTYPVHGELAAPAGPVAYELPRSHVTSSGAAIAIPAVVPAGTLHWRRFPLDEPYRQVPLERAGDSLVAVLPPQPPAGKVEYYLELPGAAQPQVPADRTVVLRYKGEVSTAVLLPHVLFMFVGMLVALRAGLGALAGRDERRLAWVTLVTLTIGGMILGPVVQRQAFGAYWTGVPFGWDLTDNKTLIAWLTWVAACLLPFSRAGWRRALIVSAALVTTAVYLIPHSVQGSQLDYTAQESTIPEQ